MLAREIPFRFAIDSRQMNGALSLDESDDLRHRILRWYRQQHVHVVGHQMPLLDPALLLRSQFLEHVPEVTPQFAIQRFPATFGNEHNVVFAVPSRVT